MIFTFLFIIRVCPTAGSSVVGNNVNDRLRVTPVVAGLLAITILSAMAAAAVMCALRVRSRRHTNQRRQDMCGIGTGSIMGGGVGGGAAVIAVCKQKTDEDDYAAAASDPDKNPDLIPPTKVKSKCATVFFFFGTESRCCYRLCGGKWLSFLSRWRKIPVFSGPFCGGEYCFLPSTLGKII